MNTNDDLISYLCIWVVFAIVIVIETLILEVFFFGLRHLLEFFLRFEVQLLDERRNKEAQDNLLN